MKKIIFGAIILSVSLLIVAGFVQAKVGRVSGPSVSGPWDLKGDYVIDFTCTSGCSGVYTHTMDIDLMNVASSTFSGTGYYNPDHSYTWNVTGSVNDSNVAFHILYTGSNAGYTVDLTGLIAADGTMSGTATSSINQTFTWKTFSGAATREPITTTYKNHGQYVRSQENKREAAQTRIGMPVQSKGHTK